MTQPAQPDPYMERRELALRWLGNRYLCAKPINEAHKHDPVPAGTFRTQYDRETIE